MTSKAGLVFTLAAALSGIALSGCANGVDGQVSVHSRSPSPVHSAAASPGQSVTPGGTMQTPTANLGTECNAVQLRIAYTNNSQIRNGALNGMSHADRVVTFTNEGSASCWTRGYPGVAALNTAGSQIEQATRTSGPAPVIVLNRGQTASSLISANTASCPKPASVPGLLVTAPDQRTSTRLDSAGQLCLNSLTVAPLQPGDAAGLKF